MRIIHFYNRKDELKKLNKYLHREGFDLIIIYGRRRIGKTALILEATKNMKRLYYMALEKNNLKSFYEKSMSLFPEISKLKADWEILFDYLKDKVQVIIIDEFQNMIKEDKSILSVFQRIVDSSQSSNLKIVLLGSTVSIITSKVLSYKSPLYGRKSLSMKLKPIKFLNLTEFFPNKKIHELVEIYGFTDGLPYYLTKIDKNISFWDWLDENLVDFVDEMDFLMKYEFEDVGTYKSILYAIALGKTKLNEIKEVTGLKRTDLSSYLKNLIEVDFVERIVPVTESPKSKKGRYYLKDNFLRFWFRYIYPNLSSIEEGVFDINLIKSDYNRYLGLVFEKICKQFLVEMIKQGIFPKFTKIGKQWGNIPKERKSYEIDIVAINEHTKEILFCECKWKDKVNPKQICKELVEKSTYVNWNNNNRKEYFVIFAKSFKEKISEFEGYKVWCFDLNDLENYLN